MQVDTMPDDANGHSHPSGWAEHSQATGDGNKHAPTESTTTLATLQDPETTRRAKRQQHKHAELCKGSPQSLSNLQSPSQRDTEV